MQARVGSGIRGSISSSSSREKEGVRVVRWGAREPKRQRGKEAKRVDGRGKVGCPIRGKIAPNLNVWSQ